MNLPALSREELFARIDSRANAVRKYLAWARENDKGTFRMAERNDITEAADVAREFAEDWWGLVVFSCFGSLGGAKATASYFRHPLPPSQAEATLLRIAFPHGSVGHHRSRPALKGAKEALVSACTKHELFHNVLSSGADFDTRYRQLREARMRQWGRTTSFDLLLRAGMLGLCGQHYKPEYAYLKDSSGPAEGFALVWGKRPTRAKDVEWADSLLRAWTNNWTAIATRVGVEWSKPPLEPCDQENFLCIYHQQVGGGINGRDCAKSPIRRARVRREC